MPSSKKSIGINSFSYQLPKKHLSLASLKQHNRIQSSVRTLSEFGFKQCYIATEDELESMLYLSARYTLEKSHLDPKDIDWFFLYSGIGNSGVVNSSKKSNYFDFLLSKLHYNLGLENATPLYVSQQGCSGVFSIIDLVSKIFQGDKKQHALCLAGDMLPAGSSREIIYNISSDAAGGFIVDNHSVKNTIISSHHITQSCYWQSSRLDQEILAAYFPLAKRAIEACLKKASLHLDDITWVVPHNVSLRSWEILAKILDIPMSKIWKKNISRVGHTISSDHIINLADMEKARVIKKGDLLLLFTFGLGAHWSCIIVEH